MVEASTVFWGGPERNQGTPLEAPGTFALGTPTELRPGDPLGSPGLGGPWERPGYSSVGIPRAREARGALGE